MTHNIIAAHQGIDISLSLSQYASHTLEPGKEQTEFCSQLTEALAEGYGPKELNAHLSDLTEAAAGV